MASAIATFLDFVMWVAGLFGLGKPDPVAQGEVLGKAETTSTDVLQEMVNVKAASDARNSVSDGADAILHDSANTGPAKQ